MSRRLLVVPVLTLVLTVACGDDPADPRGSGGSGSGGGTGQTCFAIVGFHAPRRGLTGR
jgi:hypothetical protein